MKRSLSIFRIILASIFILFSNSIGAQNSNPCKKGGQTCYFGVEINGVLSGYSVDTYCTDIFEGRDVRYEYSDVTLKMSLLGADIDGGFKMLYIIDQSTEKAMKIDMTVINGQSIMKFVSRIEGDTVYYESPTSGIKKTLPVSSDVIIASQSKYPHLYSDFIRDGITEKRYKVYDPLKGEVVEKNYERKAEENIVLNDSVYKCLILEETDLSTSVTTLLWLNIADGYNVRADVAGRKIYLADKSVTGKITFANLDKEFIAVVGRYIPDIPDLEWLKVKAEINSYGEALTVGSLNFPGQLFIGTVNGSKVDGIFEIEPVAYKGENAPPFPPDFSAEKGLKKYLSPETLIESDDPLIISEADRITSGSEDSWEAIVRLSKWVAENIAGALPGGISAINSLRTMEAECGGHSRLLAAFSRAVGIPARVIVGCMYTNYYGGGFGQHAWTEVYMGDAGWIPVDATISEIDYIDAGHIRLGENATFRPVRMEIIDLRSGAAETDEVIDAELREMTGSFINLQKYRMFRIVSKEGGLAIDIPGRAVLQLNPPDETGRWFPKLTREISLLPKENDSGVIDKIIFHEYIRLKKTSQPEAELNEIPDEFRELTGHYQLAPGRLSLDVMFASDTMSTQDPENKARGRINYKKEGDTWIDESGNYEIRFICNSEGKTTALILSSGTPFVRGEPVINAIEPLIRNSDVEAGLRKYDEIKKSGSKKYLFSVHMLHDLGHTLLKEGRIDDAIAVFLKNATEYPLSFMANDALAETYLKNGDDEKSLKYFRVAVKLNPDYEYGIKMINELRNK
jgi:TolA-binding protein